MTFDFGAKPSYHDIEIICRLVEEEFHLLKQSLKTIGWSEKSAVDIKNENLDLIITDKSLGNCKSGCINLGLKYI